MSTWLPNAQRVLGNDAGPMNGIGGRKLLLHSTEGTSIEGAISAYKTRNVWPTLTTDLRRRRVTQHLPLEVAARSLKNLAGGVETNRAGKVLVQIEIVGSAADPPSLGSPDDLAWFGREVVAPICEAMAIPIVTTVRWVAYPASYGQGAAQRLSPTAWVNYSGLLGHQHAPENDHGDPGLIDIGRILAAANHQEIDMALTADELKQIKAAAKDAVIELYETQGSAPRVFADELLQRAGDPESKVHKALLAPVEAAVRGLLPAMAVAVAAELGGNADATLIEAVMRRVLAGTEVQTTGHLELAES